MYSQGQMAFSMKSCPLTEPGQPIPAEHSKISGQNPYNSHSWYRGMRNQPRPAIVRLRPDCQHSATPFATGPHQPHPETRRTFHKNQRSLLCPLPHHAPGGTISSEQRPSATRPHTGVIRCTLGVSPSYQHPILRHFAKQSTGERPQGLPFSLICQPQRI